MVYARPGSRHSFYTEPGAFAPGLVGTLSIRIEQADNTIARAAQTTGIAEIAPGVYGAVDLGPLPVEEDNYAVLWDNGVGAVALEELRITHTLPEELGGTQLVTLDEVKTALGIPLAETDQDAKLSGAISAAIAAVKMYTVRTFDLADPGTDERTFSYDESGLIVVDDYQHGSITNVALAGVALPTDSWSEEPLVSEYPVAWWLEVSQRGRWSSPEMGFTRNEDVYAHEGRYLSAQETIIAVTARWGWLSIPADVKRAALWTAVAFYENPRAYISESIGSYSRTSANPLTDALPPRAQAALEPHRKMT